MNREIDRAKDRIIEYFGERMREYIVKNTEFCVMRVDDRLVLRGKLAGSIYEDAVVEVEQ